MLIEYAMTNLNLNREKETKKKYYSRNVYNTEYSVRQFSNYTPFVSITVFNLI